MLFKLATVRDPFTTIVTQVRLPVTLCSAVCLSSQVAIAPLLL